jgi:hypothetical protein
MNRTRWIAGLPAVAVLACAGAAFAQAPPPPPGADGAPPPGPRMHERMRGPGFWNGFELLGFGPGGGPKTIKGAPFSAKAVSETTQVLGDGTKIHRSTQASLFRDGEGRVRREMSFQGFGPLAASGTSRSAVVIHDPVAGTGYFLEPDGKTARKFTKREAGDHPSKGDGFTHRWERKTRDSGNVTTESLGTQVIEGVKAEGTRITHVIPAGQIGNDKPISVVTEHWFSNELQETVMIKRSDPRFGTTTYRLTNIQQKEPAATLFQVPADYTVKAGQERHVHRGPAPPPPGLE